MTIHTMRVQPKYFALLKAGKKRVEFRLFDEKRSQISVGDKISFICQNHPDESIIADVSEILHSSDFGNLLHSIPLNLIGGLSKDDQLRDLNDFYDSQQQKTCGVMAIILK